MTADYGQCAHDPRCIHGAACRLEQCTGCGKTWHVLGITAKSMCCNKRVTVIAPGGAT